VSLRDFGQPSIPTGKRSGLLMHTAETESDSLCERKKSWRRLWNSNRRFGVTANCLDKLSGFLTNCAPLTDLNQAEDISPARFFASSGPRTAESTRAGERKEES
jgi:hypothetical protein